MNHLHTLRVAYENWLYDNRFADLLRLLTAYRGGITNVALFTSATHAPLSPAEFSNRMAVIKKRLPALREAGFAAGINHLTTIGHHCEDLDAGLGDKYTYMTGIDGSVCRGSYCMRNPVFVRDYVVPCYTEMASLHPDFIWIDDDVRYGHFDCGKGCFCDRCIAVFNEKFGYSYTRETLRTALSEHNPTLGLQWLDHQSDAICDLFSVIADTVYTIDAGIRLGFMTGERYFEGYQFARYANALSAGGTHEIMWRPGGGAYEDLNFESIVEKMEQLGRQNAYLPDYVTVVQSEIENFPYQLLKKTPHSTAYEAAMSMTVGCTGAAFNILPSETMESLDTIIPHLRAIEGMTDFYKTLNTQLAGLTPTGIHSGWRPSSQAACPGGILGGSDSEFASYAREMFFFGLPEAYHPDFASVTMLTGQAASVMRDEEIRHILSGGVYLDASALTYLHSRGFGDLLGFEAGEQFPVDAREAYTDHEYNAGIVGGIRNCRQAFHAGDSYAMIPLREECQILSRLIDYHDRTLCTCTCGIFENSLGGRVCVSGYYPHDWLSDYQKTIQIKNIFLWLSRGTLPAFVDSYHRVRNITLKNKEHICVTLFNTANDALESVSVAVRTDSDTAMLYTMNDDIVTVRANRTAHLHGGTYRYFKIDRINAFEGVILSV